MNNCIFGYNKSISFIKNATKKFKRKNLNIIMHKKTKKNCMRLVYLEKKQYMACLIIKKKHRAFAYFTPDIYISSRTEQPGYSSI